MKKNSKPASVKSAKELKAAAAAKPAAQMKDDEVVSACRNAISAARAALAQCESCASAGDTTHAAAIAASRSCIAQCAITVEDCQYWTTATAADSVKACIDCAEMCDMCADACR